MSAADFCTVTASTKRSTADVNGRKTAPTSYLASLAITPLWPVSGQTVEAFGLNSPREFKECYHAAASGATLPDVAEGDLLTVSAVNYPIFYVGEWTDDDIPALHIIVQEVK